MTAGFVQVKKTWAGGRVEPDSGGSRQRAADSLGGGCMWESQRHSSPGSLAIVGNASGQMWMEHRVDVAVVVAAAAAVAVADDGDLQCSKHHCQQANTCQNAVNVCRCFSMLSEPPVLLTQLRINQRIAGSLTKDMRQFLNATVEFAKFIWAHMIVLHMT